MEAILNAQSGIRTNSKWTKTEDFLRTFPGPNLML